WNGVYISHGMQVTPSSYTRGLPALNVALNVTPDQVLRFAADKTQARQDLATLGRGLVIGYQVNGSPPRDPSLPAATQLFTNASSGNPELQPYRSTNYDLSYAWYFAPHSIAYLGAFFMDVSSFPESTVETVQEPDSDGVIRRSGPLFTTINGGGSIIRGLEGEFRTQFAQLPGWWSGFGVNLNYTFLRSSNPLAAGARQTYNAVVFYQKYGLQVRLAYNWHGRTLDLVNKNLSDVLNIYSKPEGYLDASVEYRINKNVSVFLQGTNLTDAYGPSYVQYPNAFWSENISERRYYAGVRLSF
ncbi:MAG: TonB-dependent receptor domain-containing protein, partial [Rhodanobacteraceae bacterium]